MRLQAAAGGSREEPHRVAGTGTMGGSQSTSSRLITVIPPPASRQAVIPETTGRIALPIMGPPPSPGSPMLMQGEVASLGPGCKLMSAAIACTDGDVAVEEALHHPVSAARAAGNARRCRGPSAHNPPAPPADTECQHRLAHGDRRGGLQRGPSS